MQFYPFRSRRRYPSAGGVNADHSWWVKCEALGKARHADEAPYLLANEWIAGSIGKFLRLPIPPFALLRKRGKNTSMFCSYNFEGDTTPNDIDPAALYKKNPSLCTGITLFDILVVNPDRHGGNIKVNNPANPTQVHVFDHDRALFYCYPGDGISRLKKRENRFGISGSSLIGGDEFHCLIELLDSFDEISKWTRRIRDIPDWFIEEICNEVLHLGINTAERDAVINFLIKRRDGFSNLLAGHWNRFPSLPEQGRLFS